MPPTAHDPADDDDAAPAAAAPDPASGASPTVGQADRRRLGRDLGIFLVAIVLTVLPTLQLLAAHDFDPTSLLKVGEQAQSRPYVDQDFDHVTYAAGWGHDGQQFYVLARNLPDLRNADGQVDRLRYRARRILLPALVLPLPRGPAKVWGMAAVSLLAVGAAAVAMGRLAQRAGASPWLGVVVGLTPAMIFSVQVTVGDGLAFALALWGVVLWRRRLGWAVVLFTLAALARETTLVAPLACLLVGDRRQRLALLAPFAVFAAWSLVIIAWLPVAPGARSANILADAADQLTVPFKGWLDMGLDSPSTLAALCLAVISGYAIVQLRDRLPEVAVWLALDVALLVLANTEVLFAPANLARVTPLAVPAFAIAVATRVRGTRTPARAAPAVGPVRPSV